MILLILALLLAAGCGGQAPRGASGRPDVSGVIKQVSSATGGGDLGNILVEGTGPSPQAASVTVTSKTAIFDLTAPRRLAGFASLKQGEQVWVWFDGPVLQSYPVQGRATEIDIHR